MSESTISTPVSDVTPAPGVHVECANPTSIPDEDVAIRVRDLWIRYRTVLDKKKTLRGLISSWATRHDRNDDVRVVDAVRGVSFDVAHGSVLGIVGPNGAGKSTLLRGIAGILPPEAGRVETDGHVATLLALGLGFNMKLTGRENITLGGRGGEGAVALARAVMEHAEDDSPFHPIYPLDAPVREKILAVARTMYGARDVLLTRQAERELAEIERLGYAGLPVCIAKTPDSLSDQPGLVGRPRDFDVTVRSLVVQAGAGFLVVLTGDVLRMPGLPRRPRAESIDLAGGRIVGLG